MVSEYYVRFISDIYLPQAAAGVTSEEQRWMSKQGRRMKTLRGDVSFFRFPLLTDQVIILDLKTEHSQLHAIARMPHLWRSW